MVEDEVPSILYCNEQSDGEVPVANKRQDLMFV